PTTDQGLQALVAPPVQQGMTDSGTASSSSYEDGGYVQKVPLDPWGNPYFYQSDGNSYTLKSFGADGAEGGVGKNADIDASQF
ncbi:MAG TPA: type II secretion system protein GspG, partial [Candidatus Binataceae bacterium]|nr:type II secretion system protein GspG [Candidatus Binataceae bacterium]